jgi:hypothetical protein
MFKLTNETSWIDFGTLDSNIVKSSDSIHWEDLENTLYWTTKMQQMEYNHEKISIGSKLNKAVIDTGTSLMHFDSTTYNSLLSSLKSSRPAADCGYSFAGYDTCFCDSVDDFKNITFHFGDWQLDVIPLQYISTGLQAVTLRKFCYFKISASSGSFYDYNALLGDSFIRNYYIVHDPDGERIGFVSYDGRTIRKSDLGGLTVLEIILIVIFSIIACLCFLIGFCGVIALCYCMIKWMTKPSVPKAQLS